MIFIAIFLAVGGVVWFISARSQSKHRSLDDSGVYAEPARRPSAAKSS